MLTPWPPYPFDGGSKRIHSLCRLLKDRVDFSLLTFRPAARDAEHAAADLRQENDFLRPVFNRRYWVDSPGRPGPAAVDGAALPADARRFYSAQMETRLRELLAGGEIDLLHVEFDLMAVYARRGVSIPRLLTQHDAGGISFFHSYFREMSGWGKWTRIADWIRRVRFARRAGGWFERIVVMTERDRRILSNLVPAEKIAAVPTGVDLEHFTPAPGPAQAETIAYVGHYPHYPNEDAVLYFLRDIFPRIRARRPNARFSIVGSGPTDVVLKAARGRPGVVVTGTVPDVKPFLAQAAVFIAPVRLGQGIKGKILEAFAMGIPVVATSRAAAGLSAAAKGALIAADSPAAFSDAVCSLLADPARRRELGERGRLAANEGYDWRKLAQSLGDIYEGLL
jgi:glycosyltransferase involved in cell wall biosynthesis